MEEQQEVPQNEPVPNLVLLKILCVFTFIGSGYLLIVFSLIAVFFGFFTERMPEIISIVPTEADRNLVELLFSAGRLFFVLNAILYAISVIGAWLLWRMKKIGFHLYTGSQLLSLILLPSYIKGFPMSLLTIFLTLLFIWGYAGFLKFMK
jgi:hypothetical protein